MHLVAGLCADPLGEFTVLLRPLSWIKVEGEGINGQGKWEKGRWAQADLRGRKEGRWGDRFPENCGEILNGRLGYFWCKLVFDHRKQVYTQNASKCTIFHSKWKHFLEGGQSLPETSPLVRRGNTKIKNSNQNNFRLLQSAKIAPRLHKNAPFSTLKNQENFERLHLLWGRGNTPPLGSRPSLHQHIPDPPLREEGDGGRGKGKKGVDDPECLKCVDVHDCKFEVALACWNVL